MHSRLMFTFLAVALHWELMVSCFSVVTPELLQCCWNPGHCLSPSECEWNFCSCVCDLWFHRTQLECWCNSACPRDANRCVRPTRPIISCYCASFVKFSMSDFISSLQGKTVQRLTVSRTLQDCTDSAAGWLLSSFPFLIIFSIF